MGWDEPGYGVINIMILGDGTRTTVGIRLIQTRGK